MTGGRMLEAVEIENTRTGERRIVETPAVFSMIGAKPCTNWFPPEIECDAKGFIQDRDRGRRRPGLAKKQAASRPARNQRARNLRCR